MRMLRLLLLLLLALLAACQDPPPQRPVDVMLRPYLLRPGVDPVGDNAVVVHLYRDNGRVKEGPGRAAGTPWTAIRLLVRIGTTLPASMSLDADDRIIDEGGGFERLERNTGSQVHSVLRFNGPCGHPVLATAWSNDTPGEGIYLAEMQMSGMFLQYAYGAKSHDDHLRFANWVYGWYMGQPCPQPTGNAGGASGTATGFMPEADTP